jgi:Flp pilus assembly protein TadG
MTCRPHSLARATGALCRRFFREARGALAVTVAIWLPLGAVLLAGSIDLASVNASHQALQDAADAAAVDAAHQLGLANNTGLSQRTSANVAAQLSASARSGMTYLVDTTVNQNPGGVTITIHANRQSFFGNLLPPGGWNFTVVSTAVQMGSMPLCVLSTGATANDAVSLQGTSHMTAPGCLLHANSDFEATSGASVDAGMVQASGLASGSITPAPQSDAPAIADPFASMSMHPLLPLCLPVTTLVANLTMTLLAGVHCGNIDVGQGGHLVLLPGEHFFLRGNLTLRQNSTIDGDDVVLFFDDNSSFQFTESSAINLRGRRTGQYAGFVLATTRANTHTFDISSSAAHELLGTVYIPSSTLRVSGSSSVADQSAWTVIVAHSLQLQGGANLVINDNYAGSSVPVPHGVGPGNGAVRLAH